MFKTLALGCVSLATFVSLQGCAPGGNDLIGGDSTGGLVAYKPSESDLTGTAGAFAGSWSGTCTYTTSTTKVEDCQATLDVQQDATMITATLTYTLSQQTRPKNFDRYTIKGNSLLNANGVVSGSIGQGGFVLYDNAVAQLSGKLVGGSTLGLVMTRLPVSTQATNKVTGFSATLTRL